MAGRLEPVPAIIGWRQGMTWRNHQFTTGLTTASFTQILAGKRVQVISRMRAFTRDHQTVCAQRVGKSPGEPRRAAHKQKTLYGWMTGHLLDLLNISFRSTHNILSSTAKISMGISKNSASNSGITLLASGTLFLFYSFLFQYIEALSGGRNWWTDELKMLLLNRIHGPVILLWDCLLLIQLHFSWLYTFRVWLHCDCFEEKKKINKYDWNWFFFCWINSCSLKLLDIFFIVFFLNILLSIFIIIHSANI